MDKEKDKYEEAMDLLLEGNYWPTKLFPNNLYDRKQDDTDGESGEEHNISIVIDFNGDVWIKAFNGKGKRLRFRTLAGGGQSLRTRNALVVLAEAIRRDNEQFPQI